MSQANFTSKLNLYEFSAYFFPGAIFLFFINVGLSLCGFNINSIKTNAMLDSVFAFFLFYFLGLLLHELSNMYQNYELLKIIDGFPSKKFLQKNSKIISDEDKKICWKLAKKHLSLNINLRHKNQQELIDKISSYSQIIYEKFREILKNELITADNLNQAEINNNHYGMYRTLILTSLLLIVFFGFTSVILCMIKSLNLVLSLLLVFFFYLTNKILCIRIKRFSNYHVKNVITQYISKNNDLHSPSFNIDR